MTRQEIINEVAARYTSETRAWEGGGGCLYWTGDGRMCAVGMMCVDARAVQFRVDGSGLAGDATSVIAVLGEEILKPEYRGHPSEFYADLQDLHDGYRYWNTDGLSSDGRVLVSALIAKWGEE